MNYKQTASDILKNIGGEGNISHIEHCSTRLRITLKDYSKVNAQALKSTPGVMGVVMTAQCQVVIGNSVIEVYDEIMKLISSSGSINNDSKTRPPDGKKKKIKIGNVILDFIVGVFQPLIPAIAGAGILKSLLLLLNSFGLIEKSGQFYTVFTNIADAAFYFLPLLVAVSAASKLKANKYIALTAVGSMLLPSLTAMISSDTGAYILGFRLQNISYASQVFPALLCVLFLAPVERLVTKLSPKSIRTFFVPLITLFITVPVTLLLLGPLGYNIGQWFTAIILFLYEKLGFAAITLLAMALPFMIATGMHKALVPYAVSSITEMGKEFLYLPASLAHNISEGGACFAAAIRTKNKDIRSNAISAGISATVGGITEPALYGITMQNRRALASVIIGCGSGALYIGLTSVAGFVAVGPGLASISMFVSEEGGRNIVNALIGAAIAFAAAFISGLILYRDTVTQEAAATEAVSPKKENHNEHLKTAIIYSPVSGRVCPLSSVKDDVFSENILGKGIAVMPDSDEIFSPADGTVETVFDSKHAITLKADNGAEILIHVGLDTVKLKGKYYNAAVKPNDKVKRGDLLLKFDRSKIKNDGYDTVTPIVIGNSDSFEIKVSASPDADISSGDALLELKPATQTEQKEN